MRVLSCGDRALLLEVDDLGGVLALDAALRRNPPAGASDVVPAARTVLVHFAAGTDLSRARLAIEQLPLEPVEPDTEAEAVEIPTVYDGADLESVAMSLGLSRAGLVAAHTAARWTVAFCGFAPGFAYLTGTDERLAAVPRRDTPRTRVPAGSVALAGGFGAVYPGPSPGGWQLLGRTELPVFDVECDPPALLRPGVSVRFVEIRSPAGSG